ncbi:hypothetical protein AAC387_Pa05g2934 [Persea americana]
MQKLWRRSPILCTSPSPWIHANPRKNPNRTASLPSIPFPMLSSFHLRPSPSQPFPLRLAALRRNPVRYRYSIDQQPPPQRPWVGFKGPGPSAVRPTWLHGGPDGVRLVAEGMQRGSCGGDSERREEDRAPEDDNKRGSEERRGLQRGRRCKGSGGGAAASADLVSGNPDLLTIPGVGLRNLRKLVEKGIGGVAELKQLYKDKFYGQSSEKMVEYLQSSVGIIHRNHAESITSFIKESVDGDLKEESPHSADANLARKKRLTFCVEGNISVGKTTFLQRIANETLELRDLVEVVPEPVSKWQDVGPDHLNILDAFYAQPQRYAFTFQNYVFVTRIMQERDSSGGVKPLRLMERSVFSDRMVFVRAVHEAKWMNQMEINIYDSWFDPVLSSLPGLIPDGFIYLRASPDTCHKRMKLRRRSEEGGVTLDYLRDLHEKHENWLFPCQTGNHGVLSVSQLPLHMDNALHPDIRDRVFYLEGNHMHSSIQKVPALVLDCEPNIDFSKDIEAKQQYARQVAEFFEFVKKKKEISSPNAATSDGNSSSEQRVVPHKSSLWIPEGNYFPNSALKSLDFGQAMSVLSG